MPIDPQRRRAMQMAVDSLKKRFGPGVIMKMSDGVVEKIAAFSTRCLALDIITGVGGVPRGRITEIYGNESAGKTTLALHLAAEVQSQGLTVAYIDAEHALSKEWAIALGVNVDDMYLSQPDSGEQGLEIAEALIRSGACDLLIVDSVAALVPRAVLDGEMGDSLPAAHARLMSQALSKINAVIHESNTCTVFINQVREKIMQGPMAAFGDKDKATGGRAMGFYASLRLKVTRTQTLKQGETPIGARTKVKVVKNKMAPPFKVCEFDLIFGKGIDSVATVFDEALARKVIQKSGSWFSFEKERLPSGRPGAVEALREDATLRDKVTAAILEAVAMETAERQGAQKSEVVS